MKRALAILVLLLLAPAAFAQEYTIKPGDTLQIEVLEDPTLNRQALVTPDGRISFPLAGSVQASGRSTSQVQSALAASLAPNFANTPNVFVALKSVAAPVPQAGVAGPALMDIYVMGEVAQPGRIEVARGTTLLQFLAEMGGFTKFAATKRIQLRRADATGVQRVYTINFKAIESGAAGGGATMLADGDVIIVPQRRLFE